MSGSIAPDELARLAKSWREHPSVDSARAYIDVIQVAFVEAYQALGESLSNGSPVLAAVLAEVAKIQENPMLRLDRSYGDYGKAIHSAALAVDEAMRISMKASGM